MTTTAETCNLWELVQAEVIMKTRNTTIAAAIAAGLLSSTALTAAMSQTETPEVVTLIELGKKYEDANRHDQAEPVLKRAEKMLRIIKNPNNDQLDNLEETLLFLGFIRLGKNDLPGAEKLFRESVAIREKVAFSMNDWNEELLAMRIDRLADTLMKEGKYKEAEAFLKRALAMREKTYGKEARDTQLVLARLAEVRKKLGDTRQADKITTSITTMKAKEYGPELGPFYYEQMTRSTTSEVILPLPPKFGPGAKFNETTFEQALRKELGAPKPRWYIIPTWLAGMWQSFEIPKNRKVKEVNGEIWDDPAPVGFYTGPGPYAVRRGFIQARDGWWDFGERGIVGNIWSTGTNHGDPSTTHTYYFNHVPVTTDGGNIVKFGTSVIEFKTLKNSVVEVTQEIRDETFKHFPKDKVALFSAIRTYTWDGKAKDEATGGVAWQRKIGKPMETKMVGFDTHEDLNNFLKHHK
jgi:hypothetical protein